MGQVEVGRPGHELKTVGQAQGAEQLGVLERRQWGQWEGHLFGQQRGGGGIHGCCLFRRTGCVGVWLWLMVENRGRGGSQEEGIKTALGELAEGLWRRA